MNNFTQSIQDIETVLVKIANGEKAYKELRQVALVVGAANSIEVPVFDLRTNKGKGDLLAFARRLQEAVGILAARYEQDCETVAEVMAEKEFTDILGVDLEDYFYVSCNESRMILYVAHTKTPLFGTNNKQAFVNYLVDLKSEAERCKDIQYCLRVIEEVRHNRLKVMIAAIVQGYGSIARKAFVGDIGITRVQIRTVLTMILMVRSKQDA